MVMLTAIIQGKVSLDDSVDILKMAVQFKAGVEQVNHFMAHHTAKWRSIIVHAQRIRFVNDFQKSPDDGREALRHSMKGVLSTECGLKWWVDKFPASNWLPCMLCLAGFFDEERPKEWFLAIPYNLRFICMNVYNKRRSNLASAIDPAWIVDNIPLKWHYHALNSFADPNQTTLDDIAAMVDRSSLFAVVIEFNADLFKTDVRGILWYVSHLAGPAELYEVFILNGTILPEDRTTMADVQQVWDMMQKYV